MNIFNLFKKYKSSKVLNTSGVGGELNKKVVLIVLDGFGIVPPSEGNAITSARTKFYTDLLTNFPNGELIASGESVGLPANEEGNTEVGHLTLSAGRVILQDFLRINKDIKNGTFYRNKAFLLALEHIEKNKSNLHLIGLLSNGNVHSSKDHLYAILEFCRQRGVKNVFLHIILDGRDSPPDDGAKVVAELEKYLTDNKLGMIATVSGRFYAMDRDRRWERTELAYNAMVKGNGPTFTSAHEAVADSYSKSVGDEFIAPSVITQNGKPVGSVNDKDSVIFFNFRIDRPRQLTMAFTLPDFENLKSFEFGYNTDTKKIEVEVTFDKTFNREKILEDLFFATMTCYQKNIPVTAIAYDEEKVKLPLPEVLSKKGLKQLRMSESEKERFVTYYFSGLREEVYPGEDIKIIPSPKISTYDKKPEMSLPELTNAFMKSFGEHDFTIINIANPDMVAHTGNFKKTVKAIEAVDWALSQIVQKVYDAGATAIITADHGNAEELLTYDAKGFFVTSQTGDRNTDHSNNPVPVIFVNKNLKGKKADIQDGSLADIAPTVLALLGVEKPEEMTGNDLCK